MKFQVGDEVRVVSAPPGMSRERHVGGIHRVTKLGGRMMPYKLSNGLWYAEDNLEEVVDHDVLMQEVLEQNNKPSIQEQLEENLLELLDEDDKVNSPSHYTRGDIEVIDIIKQLTQGYEPFEAYLVGNAIKYLARANYKENKQQDLEKAEWHIIKLLEEQSDDSLGAF